MKSPEVAVGMGLCGLLLTTYSCYTTAAEWSVEPYANASVMYDDNILFTTTQAKDTSGLLVPVGITLNRDTEITRASIKASLFIREYDDPDVIYSVDQHLDVNFGRYGERHEVGLQAGYHHDTTLYSEIDVTGPVQNDRKVNKTTASPFWQYLFSERSSLRLAYQYLDADYDAPPTEFADYTYQVGQLGYRYQFSQRVDVSLQYRYSEFRVPDIGASGLPGVKSTTDTNSYTLGGSYKFSETFSADAQLGYRDTSQQTTYAPLAGQPVVTVDGTGRLYNISLTDKGETVKWTVSASQELTPSGDGVLNQTDRVQFNINWRSGIATNIVLDAGYINSEPSVTSFSPGQKYHWLEPSMAFGLARSTSLRFSYRYSRQKYDNNPDPAESNRYMITLNHVFTKQSWN